MAEHDVFAVERGLAQTTRLAENDPRGKKWASSRRSNRAFCELELSGAIRFAKREMRIMSA
jgi:hypothetical protein